MRPLFALLFSLSVFAFVGCDDPQPKNIAEDLEQSDIDEYNRMLQEEQASMAAGDEAAKAAGVE
ncbi:MAG: hypothetical protein AAFU85_11915 [Planctomycetota bacterium]